MTKLTIFSRVGNASTEFETAARTFGEIENEFWRTVDVSDKTNLKIIDSETRGQVTHSFEFKQNHKFFIMQDQTKNATNKTLDELLEYLKKAKRYKKSTKAIKAEIDEFTQKITESPKEDNNKHQNNLTISISFDTFDQIKDVKETKQNATKISNVKINEGCISPEDMQFLNQD